MKLTVAVCTYRRFEWLSKCLESLKNQTLSVNKFRIIVVDNSLEQEKSAFFRDSLKGLSNLEYLITERAGLSYARNVALKKCITPYIAYIDDDVLAASDWAAELLKSFEDYPGAGVIGGKVAPIWEVEKPQWLVPPLWNQLAVLDWGDKDIFIKDLFNDDSKWLVGANIAYRTQALRAVGGFSSSLGRMKSLLLAHEELAVNRAIEALGYDVMYCPAIKVDHLVQAERMKKEWFCYNMLWEGASRVLLDREADHVDSQALAAQLEKSFAKLLSEYPLPDTTEGLLLLFTKFYDEGRNQCLHLQGSQPDRQWWRSIKYGLKSLALKFKEHFTTNSVILVYLSIVSSICSNFLSRTH